MKRVELDGLPILKSFIDFKLNDPIYSKTLACKTKILFCKWLNLLMQSY